VVKTPSIPLCQGEVVYNSTNVLWLSIDFVKNKVEPRVRAEQVIHKKLQSGRISKLEFYTHGNVVSIKPVRPVKTSTVFLNK